MKKTRQKRMVHEGHYVAEVDVELLEGDEGWSPYLSVHDAQKIDEVRRALRRKDLQHASELARVLELTPVQI